jgi:putative endonuclease
MGFYVYIAVSDRDGSLYTGQCGNLAERLRRHNSGLVKATKGKAPYRLGYFEEYETRAEAMWREWQLKKRFNTERKKKLIRGFDQGKLRERLGL